MKKIILIMSCIYFRISYCQDVSFYMHIDDSDFIPVKTKSNSDGYIEVKTKKIEFDKVLQKHKIKHFIQAFPTADTKWLLGVYKIKSNDTSLLTELREKFKSSISNVGPPIIPIPTYSPNDYGLYEPQKNLDLVNAKQAWDIARELPKISIGVTDTHFQTTHEDLAGQFIGVRGTNSPGVADAWHGTTVAGFLGEITDNNKGLSGISYNAKIYASTSRDDNEVLLLAQMKYRVINCSWRNGCFGGQSTYDVNLDSLYSRIKWRYNTIVVFGAGNHADECGCTSVKEYPASYSSVLSVTSIGHINPRGTVDPIYGKCEWIDCHEEVIGDTTTTHHHNDAVDICAPGYHVPGIADSILNSGKYGDFWGTSFAAPQTAATICLILSINPCLTADQAMTILKSTSDPSIYSIPENARYIGLLGSGRLDAYAAVLQAAQTATINYSTPTTLSGTQTIKSNYAIRTSSAVTVTSGSNITFMTRKEVELGPGFEVQSNSEFTVNVNVNNPIVCP